MKRRRYETIYAYAVRLAHRLHTLHEELRAVFAELDGQSRASLQLLQDELEATAHPPPHEPLNPATLPLTEST